MMPLESVFRALNDRGARYVLREFADPDKRAAWVRDKQMLVFSLRPEAGVPVVDLFLEHPIPFDQLWARSDLATLRGVQVRIASIDDLVLLKRMAGRPEDLADIEALTEIKRIRAKESTE
jgi:hypothetical protein